MVNSRIERSTGGCIVGNVVRGGIGAEENVYSSHTLTSISSLQSFNDVVGGREHNTNTLSRVTRESSVTDHLTPFVTSITSSPGINNGD